MTSAMGGAMVVANMTRLFQKLSSGYGDGFLCDFRDVIVAMFENYKYEV
jgi:hypothetical protein